MRILYQYLDHNMEFISSTEEVVLGRPRVGSDELPDLDLTPDLTVSRPHARIWHAGDTFFIQDLGSTHGTQVNGEEVQGHDQRPFRPGDIIQIGETTLTVEESAVSAQEEPEATEVPLATDAQPETKEQAQTHPSSTGQANGDSANGVPSILPAVAAAEELVSGVLAVLDAPIEERDIALELFRTNAARAKGAPQIVPQTSGAEHEGRITISLEAADLGNGSSVRPAALSTARNNQDGEASLRLALLYELLLQCGTATKLDNLLQVIIERLVESIPAASRGALLLRGRDSDTLLLKAFRSAQGPVVSEKLARRAMREGIGFVWKRGNEHAGGSIAHFRIESGMYAPLMWQGEALGVLCVDSPQSAVEFSSDDLRLLITVSHYLAMALANEQLQEELRRESAIKANLLRQFSPQIAEQLLTHGTLQLSGERSEVTILCSDIRGFTNLTKNMEPIDVVELLNDYFSRLIPIIFAHGGTIDKYIGDAILAVFGSPKKDPQQHENALRAALGMQAEMLKSNQARDAKGKVICNIGIGVHSGEVLHGFVGAVDRMELTVIGDAVNRATRFCDGARGGEVIISPQLYQWVWKMAEVEPTTVNTKHGESFPAFRLMNMKDTPAETPVL
jgi:adenylate cyclase